MEKEPYAVRVKATKCGLYTPWLTIPGIEEYPLSDEAGRPKKYSTRKEAWQVGVNSYLTHINHYHHKLTSREIRTETARERAEKLFKGRSK